MTASELTAMQTEHIRWMQDRIDALERELSELGISAGARRQRRYRERHQPLHQSVTKASPNVTQTSPLSTESVTEASLLGGRGAYFPLSLEPSPSESEYVAPKETSSLVSTGRGAGETNVTLCDASVTETFDPFWAAYPKNHGSRAKAETAWKRLSKKDREAATNGARNYATSARVIEGGTKYTKYVEGWLNGRCWESWQEPEAKERPAFISGLDEFNRLIDAGWSPMDIAVGADRRDSIIEGELLAR